jgi:phosphoribosylformylglycinamidine synthase
MSDGGLAVALAESAMGGMCGCDVDLSGIPGDAALDDIRTLFAESPSRFVISVKKENADKFEKLMAGAPLKRAGETNSSDAVEFRKDGKTVLTITCDEIVKAWKREI